MNARHLFFILSALLFCCIPISAQQEKSQQIIDVARTCTSGNHEPSDCQLINTAATSFQLSELSDYSKLLEKNELDLGNKKLISALTSLLDYVERLYGKECLEAIIVRRELARILPMKERETALSMMEENLTHLSFFLKKQPKNKHAVQLKLATLLEKLLIKKQCDLDNPEHIKQFIDIQKEVVNILKDNKEPTPELASIFVAITNLDSYESWYTEYLRYLNISSLPNILDFAQKAYDMGCQLWAENDLRRLDTELLLLNVKARSGQGDFDTLHQRIDDIQHYVSNYMPAGSIPPIDIELIKWDCDIMYGQQTYEIRIPDPLLYQVEAFYGAESEEYLLYLDRMFVLQALVYPQRAAAMWKDVESKITEVLVGDEDRYIATLTDQFFAMKSLAQSNPQAFNNYMESTCSSYLVCHQPTWSSIYSGRTIAYYYNSLNLSGKAIETCKIALQDTQELAGTESFAYLDCLFFYACLQYQSTVTETQHESIDSFKTILQLCKKFSFNIAEVYHFLSDTQSMLGQYAEAEQTLKEGIEACRKANDKMWQSLFQMEQGWLHISIQNKGVLPEAKELFEKATTYFMEHHAEINIDQFIGYLYLNNYYKKTHQLDKAEEILLLGLEHHEMISSEHDAYYNVLITELYELYANDLNDMDKAERLITQCLNDAKKNPTYVQYSAIWQLLWKKYNYISQTNRQDFVLRWNVMKDLIKLMREMISLAGGNAAELKDMVMPLLYEVINIGTIAWYFEKTYTKNSIPENEETRAYIKASLEMSHNFRVQIKTEILPLLLEREQELKQQRTDYLNITETQQLYFALANCYLGAECDTLKAESYYEELRESSVPVTRYGATYQLANLAMQQHQYERAARLFDHMEEQNAQTPVGLNSKSDKALINRMRAMAYYLSGHYDQALSAAKEEFCMRQQLITQNFDLMTEAERNDFIDNGGAGSEGLLALLPHFRDSLAPDGYNAALAEKGVLLRASERIKKAIIKTADPLLQARIDSLNALRSAYKQMNADGFNEQGFFLLSEDVVQTREAIELLEREINRSVSQNVVSIRTADWRNLQKVLKTDEATVEYVFCDSIVGALILLPYGTPQFVQLPAARDLHIELESLSSLPSQERSELLYANDKLHLYHRIWEPLEPILNGAKTIFYSPVGYLNALAFGAIKCNDDNYLMERYDLHQMLSTGDLIDLRQNEDIEKINSCTLFGGVFYSPEQQYRKTVTNNNRGAIEDAFGYLPYTLKELQAVVEELKEHDILFTEKIGFDTSEAALRSIDGNSPDVLHLSTHGFYIATDTEVMNNSFLKRFPNTRFHSMQRSGLAFCGANGTWEGDTCQPEESDGILTANEVSMLDFSHTRLAVLSACQTAIGKYTKEGVLGMHRGFKQAGVKSILATLWNVNDESTSLLMKYFYQKWLNGTPMQQSLKDAILELRKDYPSPYYWAPFVLMDAEN